MLYRRTDLAFEEWQARRGAGTLPGVESRELEREGFPVTVVNVLSPEGERALGKPVGSYVTVELSQLKRREEDAFGRAVRALSGEIGAFSVVRKATLFWCWALATAP